nr:MAG TPA: Regulatory peptide helical complex, MEMBRANE PROTEIN [Caudoviricetes sp.]
MIGVSPMIHIYLDSSEKIIVFIFLKNFVVLCLTI